VPERKVAIGRCARYDKELSRGGVCREQREYGPFGRILAQTAKQVIVQKVGEAERAQWSMRQGSRRNVGQRIVKRKGDRTGVCRLGAMAAGFIEREDNDSAEPVRSRNRIKASYLKEVAPSRADRSCLSRKAGRVLDRIVQAGKAESPRLHKHFCGGTRCACAQNRGAQQ